MWGRKRPLEPLLLDFSVPGENDGYCLEWIDPIGVFPVGASGCGGDCERADLTGSKP